MQQGLVASDDGRNAEFNCTHYTRKNRADPIFTDSGPSASPLNLAKCPAESVFFKTQLELPRLLHTPVERLEPVALSPIAAPSAAMCAPVDASVAASVAASAEQTRTLPVVTVSQHGMGTAWAQLARVAEAGMKKHAVAPFLLQLTFGLVSPEQAWAAKLAAWVARMD